MTSPPAAPRISFARSTWTSSPTSNRVRSVVAMWWVIAVRPSWRPTVGELIPTDYPDAVEFAKTILDQATLGGVAHRLQLRLAPRPSWQKGRGFTPIECPHCDHQADWHTFEVGHRGWSVRPIHLSRSCARTSGTVAGAPRLTAHGLVRVSSLTRLGLGAGGAIARAVCPWLPVLVPWPARVSPCTTCSSTSLPACHPTRSSRTSQN